MTFEEIEKRIKDIENLQRDMTAAGLVHYIKANSGQTLPTIEGSLKKIVDQIGTIETAKALWEIALYFKMSLTK